jgi:hypothetical protein
MSRFKAESPPPAIGEIGETMKKNDGVFIRTITFHYVGRVVRLTRSWVELEDASWVAESGRFGAALLNGTLEEVERIPGRVSVARGCIVDVTEWSHALPVVTRP